MTAVEAMEKLLRERGVRHFTANEILTLGASNKPGGRAEGLNYLPRNYYELSSLADVAKLADRIRHSFGGPIVVLSGFRSEAYNRAVGGEPNSYHMRCMALDISPNNGDVEKLWLIAEYANPQGGLGKYSWGIHIDTRGRRARW